MPAIGLLRFAAVASLLLIGAQVFAQGRGDVHCGDGYYCPPGNACLVGGLCGQEIAAVPGSTRTTGGKWCEPGFRENRFTADQCIPESYTECRGSGLSCPTGSSCSEDGRQCVGGPPATGPTCGAVRCAEGRVCSSKGSCMNPQFFRDCGNGTICTKSAACEHPRGCVFVSSGRTTQFQGRR